MVICKEEGCKKSASYGFVNEPIKYCTKHKLEGMINPYYKYNRKKRNIEIIPDKKPEAASIDITKKKYKFISKIINKIITASSITNTIKPTRKKYTRTKPHKYPCQHDNCKEKALYGTKHGDKPVRCKEHRLDGLVIWSTRRTLCNNTNCVRTGQYNLEGCRDKYCYDHKEEGMIRSIKLCEREGCIKGALFDKPDGNGRFCADHKENGMINIKSKKCAHSNCIKQPSFNFVGKSALFCMKHRLVGMIDVNNMICIEPGCSARAKYGNERRKPKYCNTHKKEGMIIGGVLKYCQECNTIINVNSFKPYCKNCYNNIYLDTSSSSINVKERDVAKHVLESIDGYSIILDQRIKGGYSKHRPDILIDLDTHIMIVEIDEEQHRVYSKINEDRRLLELYKDGRNRPLYVLRFNPDSYIDKNGTSISSCWKHSKYNGCVIRNDKIDEWKNRLDILIDYMLAGICLELDKDIEVKYLFYDGWEN
ncbi:hypothetical protein [Dishui Lake large algae virus 1]|nr:hypothetical protein [Dishui Lake large algae virus 1]